MHLNCVVSRFAISGLSIDCLENGTDTCFERLHLIHSAGYLPLSSRLHRNISALAQEIAEFKLCCC